MSETIDELKKYFLPREESLSKTETVALFTNSFKAPRGIAFPDTDPAVDPTTGDPTERFAGENWDVSTADYGATFVHFNNITVPIKVGAQYVAFARFVWNDGAWGLERELVDVVIPGIEGKADKSVTDPVTNAIKINSTGAWTVEDINGYIGIKFFNGLFETVAGLFKDMTISNLLNVINLKIGDKTLSSDSAFLQVFADAAGRVGYGVKKNGEVLARQVTTKKLVVSDSVTLPASFQVGGKMPFVYGPPTDWLLIMSYGQSNSNGGGIASAVTTVQLYDSLMPKGGRSVSAGGDYSDVIPYIESSSETPLPGLFEYFIQKIASQNFLTYKNKGFNLIGTCPGQGSTAIAGLSKGSAPYTRLIGNVAGLNTLAVAQGKTFSVPFITWTQGENNVEDNTTYAAYVAALKQLIADLNTDIKAITGQKHDIPLITYQVTWQTANNDSTRISKALLDQGLSNPLVVCAVPFYIFDYDLDGYIHIIPAERRKYGAYLAKAAKKLMVDGKKFLPLHPVSFTVNGNNLLVKYHVPVQPLVLDTTLMPDPGTYGFRIFSAASAQLVLSNIKVINGDTVSIDCSASPTGGTFAYARAMTDSTRFPNPDGISGKQNSRGCLRDSEGLYETFDSYPLHNWAVASYLPIN